MLVAGLAAVNATNFAFHFIISRRLGPDAYGALGALLGIILVLSVPAAALQVVITREVASRRAGGGRVVPVVAGPLLAEAVLWGSGAALVLAASSPLLRSFLHLPSLSTALLLSAYAIPVAIGLVPRAVLLGEMRFKLVAVATVAGGAARLGLGVVLVEAGAGVNGAVAASVLAAVVEAAVLLPGMRSMLQEAEDVEPLRTRWSDTSSTLVAMVGFWAFTGIGTLLARHYLPRAESGFYAAAWTAATAAMFLPGAVSFIAFPRFVDAGTSYAKARAILVQSLSVVGLLAFGAAAVTVVASSAVIRLLFGPEFAASTAMVGTLALAGAFLALTSLLMHFHVARQNRAAASMSWAGIAGTALAGVIFHSSALVLAWVVVTAAGAVAGVMLWAAFRTDDDDVSSLAFGSELWDLPQADRDVTIVVPFYNPGPRFRPNIDKLVEVLSSSGSTFEVVAVSDGCTDGSEHSLAGLDEELVRSVDLGRNWGKGRALSVGLAMGRGHYLGFIDADGDLDPELLLPFLGLVNTEEPDVIVGSKRHPLSRVYYPPLRRLYSWGYQQLTRLLFRLDVRDTQTGLKLVRREVLAEALPRMVEKRFAFDLELLVVARRLGWIKFVEAPVVIKERFSSTISLSSVWPMLVDTLAIFYRLRILNFYGPAKGAARRQSVPAAARTNRLTRQAEPQ